MQAVKGNAIFVPGVTRFHTGFDALGVVCVGEPDPFFRRRMALRAILAEWLGVERGEMRPESAVATEFFSERDWMLDAESFPVDARSRIYQLKG